MIQFSGKSVNFGEFWNDRNAVFQHKIVILSLTRNIYKQIDIYE